jgi:hypothetical protein
MDHAPGPIADDAGLDPWQAAVLLDQATEQARRTFTPGTPALWIFRAVLALVAFGGFWLSVRGQDPYSGPTRASLLVAFALVAVNIGWSARALRRAGAGVSGPAQRKRQAWIGVMLVVLVAANAVAAPLYGVGASHPVWGLYPASAPLMITGLAGAAAAAALGYWPAAGTLLAIAAAAATAGFGGPVGSWLVMGIGLSGVCLGKAGFTVSRQRRSVVRL